VLGRGLRRPQEPVTAEIDVGVVGPADLDTWIELVVAGFAVPDTGGVGGDTQPAYEVCGIGWA
jgi:hypothetical protein